MGILQSRYTRFIISTIYLPAVLSCGMQQFNTFHSMFGTYVLDKIDHHNEVVLLMNTPYCTSQHICLLACPSYHLMLRVPNKLVILFTTCHLESSYQPQYYNTISKLPFHVSILITCIRRLILLPVLCNNTVHIQLCMLVYNNNNIE